MSGRNPACRGGILRGLTALIVLSSPAAARQPWSARPAGADPAAFLAEARAGSARFRDHARAVAEGYRLAGADFPAMGEHWIHPGLLFRAVFDPRQPTILSYVTVSGRRVLAGVGWALPLAPAESHPEFPSPEAWHAHAGTLGDAILAAAHAGHPDRSGWRLAVLHAWIWEENPAGTFTTDNWRLPWLRAGHQPPPGASRAAAAGLSLVTTPEFYAELVALTPREPPGHNALAVALAAAQAEAAAARGILMVAPDRGAASLAGAWSRLEPLLIEARRREMLP